MLRSQSWIVAVAIIASVLSPSVNAQDKPTSLDVYPPEVHINTMRDRQSFVVQVAYPNGLTRDVTKEAKLTLSDAAKVKLAANVLHPVADGESQLTVEFEGLTKTIPIKIEQADLHEVQLQHGKLPRRCSRQRWLPIVAVWF
jgi:YbbR domain-containing protein